MESDILKYILPFLDEKYFADVTVKADKKIDSKEDGLEELIIMAKGKIKNVKGKPVKKANFDLEEKIGFEKDMVKDKKARLINYSLKLEKEKTENKGYLVSIDYQENEKEEKLDINVQVSGKGSEKDANYSFSVLRKKEGIGKPYELKINYSEQYDKERLEVNYRGEMKDYIQQHLERINDFSSKVLFSKHLDIMPASWMGGILGFTYLGENYMARRDDLSGSLAHMVDTHEAIHTPDEYETRVLTSWMLSKEMPKYVK